MRNRASGDWEFCEDSANHAIRFIEELEHTTGEYAGRNFTLEPWQSFIVWNLFGFKRDGFRRFTRAYVEVPRKNGKSTFSSAIMLYGLLMDEEAAAQVYSAATKLDQAMMVFGESVRVCQNIGWLNEAVLVNNSTNNRRIVYGQSIYRPLEWNPNKQDGLNTHMAVIDEYHAHPNDDLYNVLRNSMGARRQPLLFTITTAGFNRESPCYKHRQYCASVLDGSIVDDSLFSVIYTLDDGDDWTDSKNWQKANPNWGISVYPRQLEQALTEAKEFASKEVEFKTKLLNVWTDTAVTWIPDADWKLCEDVGELVGPCYGGLDLATTGDFCAFSLYWPESGALKTWYFMHEEGIKRRRDAAGQSIRQWVADGVITPTEGNVTDYNYIKQIICELSVKYDIKDIAFDRYNSSQLVIDLQVEGLQMFPFGQGFVSMNAPTVELERLVKAGRIKHGGNPVTRWMMSNVMLRTDPAGNVKIDKAKSGDKVDGPVSIVMALGTAMQDVAKEDDGDFWYMSI
ncbi:terminase large subunit [Runella sp.]|uniref:terminase large subunit n=1 Tax=Runella sp. TaxID=1960881 RepID=UPI0030160FC2